MQEHNGMAAVLSRTAKSRC